MAPPDHHRSVLVSGATGYIGGRLVPELLASGRQVRCLARTPEKLDDRPWRSEVEVAAGDVTDLDSLAGAMDGVDAAYYLVHSMGGSDDFARQDREAAAAFRDAAAKADVKRLVYLGGLGRDDDPDLSRHLQSRHEVGRMLADGPVPVTELRAAVIIGSGSASFEMLRYLVEVLPVMITPKWVDNRCQPIAIADVLHYLTAVLDTGEVAGRVLEIGGPDVVTYRDMMAAYAEGAGLVRRRVVGVPVLTPKLSSLWVGLVTPLPAGLGQPLVESLINEVVVDRHPVSDHLDHRCLTFAQAIEAALRRSADAAVDPSWSGARPAPESPADPSPSDPGWAGGSVLSERWEPDTGAAPSALLAAARECTGRYGRTEAGEPETFLRLRVERRLPGDAWLEWRCGPGGGRQRGLDQRAVFIPRGLAGRLAWYGSLPLRRLALGRLAGRIVRQAEAAGEPQSG